MTDINLFLLRKVKYQMTQLFSFWDRLFTELGVELSLS